MKAKPIAALVMALMSTSAGAASAKSDCAGGYRSFLGKVSPYIERVDDADLPALMRRGLSVFEACAAGDTFTPHGIWGQIAADMQKKFKKSSTD